MELPLNLDHIYVMAKTKSGCEVYFPIKDSDDINEKKELYTKIMEDY